MTSHTPSYHGYRFPREIISHAVWLYHRFGLSFRDAEDLLAQRGVRSPTRRFGSGVTRLGPTTLGRFAADEVEWVTPGIWMNSS